MIKIAINNKIKKKILKFRGSKTWNETAALLEVSKSSLTKLVVPEEDHKRYIPLKTAKIIYNGEHFPGSLMFELFNYWVYFYDIPRIVAAKEIADVIGIHPRKGEDIYYGKYNKVSPKAEKFLVKKFLDEGFKTEEKVFEFIVDLKKEDPEDKQIRRRIPYKEVKPVLDQLTTKGIAFKNLIPNRVRGDFEGGSNKTVSMNVYNKIMRIYEKHHKKELERLVTALENKEMLAVTGDRILAYAPGALLPQLVKYWVFFNDIPRKVVYKEIAEKTGYNPLVMWRFLFANGKIKKSFPEIENEYFQKFLDEGFKTRNEVVGFIEEMELLDPDPREIRIPYKDDRPKIYDLMEFTDLRHSQVFLGHNPCEYTPKRQRPTIPASEHYAFMQDYNYFKNALLEDLVRALHRIEKEKTPHYGKAKKSEYGEGLWMYHPVFGEYGIVLQIQDRNMTVDFENKGITKLLTNYNKK